MIRLPVLPTLAFAAFALWGAVTAPAPALAQQTDETPAQQAQQQQRPYHVFMILGRGETEVEQGFRDYFRDKGIELTITVRNIENDPSKVPGFVEEAKRLRPDLVYTWGTPSTIGTVGAYDAIDPEKHITDIPVVFTLVASPLGARIVPSLESSGRNVTGASHIVPILTQVNAIRAYREFHRLAVIYNPRENNSVQQVNDLRVLAEEQGFELIDRPVRLDENNNPLVDSIPEVVADIATQNPDFLYLGPDTFVAGVNLELTMEAAMAHGLATFSATERPLRDSQSLFGLVTGFYNLGRLTAYKAEQILLDGIAPRDIPVETLTRFSYIVRMDVARQLELYPPMAILGFAEIIE